MGKQKSKKQRKREQKEREEAARQAELERLAKRRRRLIVAAVAVPVATLAAAVGLYSSTGDRQLAGLLGMVGIALWVPILLGALFRDIGTPDVPMFAMNSTKQAWAVSDLRDWADWWGVPSWSSSA